jgi:hypothetical protein
MVNELVVNLPIRSHDLSTRTCSTLRAFCGSAHSLPVRFGGRNPKGCQIVAGGRSAAKTSGNQTKLRRTLEGCQSSPLHGKWQGNDRQGNEKTLFRNSPAIHSSAHF